MLYTGKGRKNEEINQNVLQAHTGCILLVFAHMKPEETSGQTSCVQAAQTLVTGITNLHIIQEVEVIMGGDWNFAMRRTPQDKYCGKQFRTSESRIAKFLRNKTSIKKSHTQNY